MEWKMECMLCFELYNEQLNKPYSLYKCGHTYCISCINSLREHRCPMCNQMFIDKIPCYAVIQMMKEPVARTPDPDPPAEETIMESENPHDEAMSIEGMYLTFESYEKKLFEILDVAGGTNLINEMIFEGIESEFGGIDSHVQNKVFIRALVTAVCRFCLETNNILHVARLKSLCSLLSIFINRNQEFEFETFFAIKTFQQKLPNQPGFITSVLETFYLENMFSDAIKSVISSELPSARLQPLVNKILQQQAPTFVQPLQPSQSAFSSSQPAALPANNGGMEESYVYRKQVRKCGICRVEGHNRSSCPQRQAALQLNS